MNNFPTDKTYGDLLSSVSRSAKVLMLNDLRLMNEELKTLGKDIKHQTVQIAVFGFLFSLSMIPLLIFAILALGDILDGEYWASALIVGLVGFFVGMFGASFAYNKLINLNFKLSKTRAALKREGQIIYREVSKLRSFREGHRAAQ